MIEIESLKKQLSILISGMDRNSRYSHAGIFVYLCYCFVKQN